MKGNNDRGVVFVVKKTVLFSTRFHRHHIFSAMVAHSLLNAGPGGSRASHYCSAVNEITVFCDKLREQKEITVITLKIII